MKRLIPILLCLSVLLCACGANADTADDTATPDSATAKDTEAPTQKPTQKPTGPPSVEELARKRVKEIFAVKKTPERASIKAEAMEQYPELPTGCETVALTIALNSMGYHLKKTEIASDYLIYGDFVDGFAGDPFSDNGAGVLPPGLIKTVENFAKKTGAKVYAQDTTGASLSDLYKFIDAGCPVVMWTTYYMDSPMFNGEIYHDGESYPWYDNEHCVTLCGYDRKDDTVEIADPLRGIVTVDAGRFESLNKEIGGYSMILLDTSHLK